MTCYSPEEQKALDAFLAMSASDISGRTPVAHAVARLVLSDVHSHLPQCGVISPEGRVALTRAKFPTRRQDVVLLPQFLFMINWADSAPGISWPETYYATCLPIIDRCIVTASQDCPDMWGVTDLAIGSFDAGSDLLAGSGEVIAAWWAIQRDCGATLASLRVALRFHITASHAPRSAVPTNPSSARCDK